MAEIAWPASATPFEFTLGRYTKVFRGTSAFGKSGQNIDTLNDRWKISCSIGIRDKEEGAELEAFINSLRSGAGVVRCHHFGRPTIRGVLTNATTTATAKGAQVLTFDCTAGDYLKAGDMLGVGDQLFEVALDSNSVGTTINATVTLRSRKSVATGLLVQTSQPTGKFRLSNAASTSFGPGGVTMGVDLEFVEVPV